MHLTKNDVIVLQGGSNDVYCNNAKVAILQIRKFCEVANNTNIIIVDIPHRYDLGKNSIVNKEIQAYNRKLKNVSKHFNRVTILESSLDREAFTQHGRHLNRLGKRLTAKQIAVKIYGLIEEKGIKVISLEWKSIPKGNTEIILPASSSFNTVDEEQQSDSTNSEQNYTVHDTQVKRSSTRLQKRLVTKNDDFLWETLSRNLVNKGCDSNLSSLTSNSNANQKDVHFKDKLYSINSKFVDNMNDDSRNQFRIFHQNIRGLNGKTEELMILFMISFLI
jgi:hypothetical protein